MVNVRTGILGIFILVFVLGAVGFFDGAKSSLAPLRPDAAPMLYSPSEPLSLSFEPSGAPACYIKVKFIIVHAGTVASTPALLKEVWSPEKKKSLTEAAFALAKGKITEWYTGGPSAPTIEMIPSAMLTTTDEIKKYFGNTVIKESPSGFFSKVDAPQFKDKIVEFSTSDLAAYTQLASQARRHVPDDTIPFFVVDSVYFGEKVAGGLYFENHGFGILSYSNMLNTYKAYKDQNPANATWALARAFTHELGHGQTLDDAEPGNPDNIMCSFFTQESCTDSFAISEFQKRAFRAHAQGQCVKEGNYAPKIAGVYSVEWSASNGICENRKTSVDEECENDWFNDIPSSKVKSSQFDNPSYCMAVIDGSYVSINPYNVSKYKQSHPDKVKICNQDTCKCESLPSSGGSSIGHPPLIAVGTPRHTLADPSPNPTPSPSPGPGPTSSHPPVITPPSCALKKESTACAGAVVCMDTPAGECLDADGQVVCYCTPEDGCYSPVCPADGYCPKIRDGAGQLIDQVCTSTDTSCGCAPKTPAGSDEPEDLTDAESDEDPSDDPLAGGDNPP